MVHDLWKTDANRIVNSCFPLFSLPASIHPFLWLSSIRDRLKAGIRSSRWNRVSPNVVCLHVHNDLILRHKKSDNLHLDIRNIAHRFILQLRWLSIRAAIHKW